MTCSMARRTPRPPTLVANYCDAVSGECTKVRITECRVSTLHDEKSLIAIPTPRGATTIGSTTCPTGQLGHHFTTTRHRASCVH